MQVVLKPARKLKMRAGFAGREHCLRELDRFRYRERFSFILVDEYQDTNRAQFRFVEMLAQGHGSG